MKQINDPVFGDLEFDEGKKGWNKKIPLGIWFDDYQLDLVVKCGADEDITDEQRVAYKSYLDHLKDFAYDVYEVLFSYYKDHYEEFNRRWDLQDNLKIDVVDPIVTLGFFYPSQLFIDRKGNYGWLGDFISSRYLISVVLSDGKPKIFKDWTVFEDYGVVDDDVFGEMFFDNGWRKWIKTDINGIDGEWLLLEARAPFRTSKITPEQRSNYQKYFQNEKNFLEEYPKVLLEYYKENYDVIAEIWSLADLYDEDHIDLDTVKSFIQFQKLFFHRGGERFGWICECGWDSVYGLAIYYDNTKEGICIGQVDALVI